MRKEKKIVCDSLNNKKLLAIFFPLFTAQCHLRTSIYIILT
jgi:hypothetical protein